MTAILKVRSVDSIIRNRELKPDRYRKAKKRAYDRSRTGDLVITNDALYLLSYISICRFTRQ